YGRIPLGQTGKPSGTYSASFAPVARWQDLTLPILQNCSSITANPTNFSSVNVDVEVVSSCNVNATDMAFGSVTALAAQTSTSNPLVNCSAGAPYTVTLDAGMYPGGSVNDRRMQLNGSGPATVEYQLYRDSARTQAFGSDASTDVEGTGTGAAQPIPVYG